jgi:hypothetical protein
MLLIRHAERRLRAAAQQHGLARHRSRAPSRGRPGAGSLECSANRFAFLPKPFAPFRAPSWQLRSPPCPPWRKAIGPSKKIDGGEQKEEGRATGAAPVV